MTMTLIASRYLTQSTFKTQNSKAEKQNRKISKPPNLQRNKRNRLCGIGIIVYKGVQKFFSF